MSITPQPFLLQQVSQKVTSPKDTENCTVCFFDFETIGLSDECEIVQVSLVDFDRLRMFDQYVYLNGRISFGVTKVTGIIKSSGKFFCQGNLVDAFEVNVGWIGLNCG